MTQWRDETFAAMMQSGKWTLDPRVIGAFVDTYPEVVPWFIDKVAFTSGYIAARNAARPLE